MERYKILSIEIDGHIYDLRQQKDVKVTQVKQVDNPKLCPGCEQVKSLSDFHKSSSTRDGHQSWCKQCTRLSELKTRKKAKLLECRKCGKVLDEKTMFYKGEHTCKDCRKKRQNLVHLIAVKKIITEQTNKNPEVPVFEGPSGMEKYI